MFNADSIRLHTHLSLPDSASSNSWCLPIFCELLTFSIHPCQKYPGAVVRAPAHTCSAEADKPSKERSVINIITLSTQGTCTRTYLLPDGCHTDALAHSFILLFPSKVFRSSFSANHTHLTVRPTHRLLHHLMSPWHPPRRQSRQ
jgi:hypothetical protein